MKKEKKEKSIRCGHALIYKNRSAYIHFMTPNKPKFYCVNYKFRSTVSFTEKKCIFFILLIYFFKVKEPHFKFKICVLPRMKTLKLSCPLAC